MIFRDLQDFHTFAPPKFQISAKNRQTFLRNLNHFISFHSRFSIDFAIFRRKFYEILPEFRRSFKEMTEVSRYFEKKFEKILKMLEISGIYENFHFSFHFFIRLPNKHSLR